MLSSSTPYHVLQSIFHVICSEPASTNIYIADFDAVSYHLSTPDSKTQLLLSMKMPCWKDLVACGAADVLRREYGDMLQSSPEAGYDVSLKIDLEKPKDESVFSADGTLLETPALCSAFVAVVSSPLEIPVPAQAKRNGCSVRTSLREPKSRRRRAHDGYPISRTRGYFYSRNCGPSNRRL